jgi:short subunit dehydrogenase-like uncharacterized protein
MSMKKSARPYDLVVFGATGFVGRQTVAYLAQHAKNVTWAVAGRNRSKLQEILRLCNVDVPMMVADAQDAAALATLAASARVVLSSAGPYALYGSQLVAACVSQRTHYVDITGETPWVREMIDTHHTQAQRDGTRIVPGCGFDSVPSDLGAYVVAQTMLQRHAVPCTQVKASFSIRGGLNGGTLASIMNIMGQGQKQAFSQPFLLNPEHTPSSFDAAHQDPIAPHHDKDFNAWMGPFFMGPINTRVVRRSAALWQAAGDTAYADHFYYQEYLRVGRGALGALLAAGLSAGSLATQGALQFAALRKITQTLAPKPGQGPSEVSMDNGSFRCQLIGTSAQGTSVRATISDQGDPGNRATTRMVCESALALVLDTDSLPGGPQRGGVLTPAYALGHTLVARLRAAGMCIEVES